MRFKQMQRFIFVKKIFGVRCTLILKANLQRNMADCACASFLDKETSNSMESKMGNGKFRSPLSHLPLWPPCEIVSSKSIQKKVILSV